jgi:hypothetical protein
MAIESDLNRPPEGFGPPLFVYRPSRRWGRLGVLLLAGQVALLFLTFQEMLPIGPLLPILLAVVLFPLGFALSLELVKTPYVVCPEGVVFFKGRRWHACPWDEVKAIWLMTTISHHEATQSCSQDYSCELLCQDGTRLRLKHFRTEEFIKWVEQEVYRALVPKVQAQWAAGEPVWFGAVSLSRVGIHCGKAVLPWGDVQSLQAERNENDVVVRERGRWDPWKVLDGIAIPNPALFFQLVEENISLT